INSFTWRIIDVCGTCWIAQSSATVISCRSTATKIYTLSLHDALPICQAIQTETVSRARVGQARQGNRHALHGHDHVTHAGFLGELGPLARGKRFRFELLGRSEERRVGKECRSWWRSSGTK